MKNKKKLIYFGGDNLHQRFAISDLSFDIRNGKRATDFPHGNLIRSVKNVFASIFQETYMKTNEGCVIEINRDVERVSIRITKRNSRCNRFLNTLKEDTIADETTAVANLRARVMDGLIDDQTVIQNVEEFLCF